MNKSLLAAILLASAVAPAAAQEATVPIDVFLEQRVAEELAADGTILSRLGVALDVEAVGDKLLVSLVDPATRRAVASTKVDSVPADREAAVAAVMQVTANLVAQLGRTAQPAAAPAPPAADTAKAVKQVIDEERADRASEYRFRQEAITFGDEVAVFTDGKTTSVRHEAVAYQGDMHRKLEPREFYELVGRADLADAYDRRTAIAWGGLIGGGVVAMTGGLLWAKNLNPSNDCDPLASDYMQCSDRADANAAPVRTAGMAMFAVGSVGALVGIYYIYHRHPVSDSERYELAASHNAELRAQYGLPTARLHRPRTTDRSFVIAPYASSDAGGFAIAGRF
jgi:hypothetical protein